jgi:hypothetical protein
MATHISFTLPVDLSTEEQKLLKEMLPNALRAYGANVVADYFDWCQRNSQTPVTADVEAYAEMARLSRILAEDPAQVDVVDKHNRTEWDGCPCCGVAFDDLRGIGSSIW